MQVLLPKLCQLVRGMETQIAPFLKVSMKVSLLPRKDVWKKSAGSIKLGARESILRVGRKSAAGCCTMKTVKVLSVANASNGGGDPHNAQEVCGSLSLLKIGKEPWKK